MPFKNMKFLDGIKIVSVAVNVPGPAAAARLVSMGAECTKVEPPSGDQLKSVARQWYDLLLQGQAVLALDLKTQQGQEELARLLGQADLLITSFRPSALQRLGLGWEELHAKYPRLCVVNIVGYPPPHEDVPGHDLTYQAKLGLLRPPDLPITLHADMAGAERCVTTALALLLNFARTGKAERVYVSLYEALGEFTGPLKFGLTSPGGMLNGNFAFYSLYQASDGWIALGALEPVFVKRLIAELNMTTLLRDDPRKELEQVFTTRTAAEWEQWARERDLPIVAVAST
jgi:alpha-methylacyl-CoA racemase